MKFTDPQGRSLEVTSPDGSIPTEQELDQMFSIKYGNITGTPSTPKTPDSVISQGLGFVQQHPFKTALQPLAQTIGGKSFQDMALEASRMNIPTPNQAPYDSNVIAASTPMARFNAQGNSAMAGMAGSVADMVTTPANYMIPPLIKPIGAGIEAMGNTLSKIPAVMNTAKAANLESMFNKAFVGVKQAATDKFGTDLHALAEANPEKAVSLKGVVENLAQNWNEMAPEAKSVLQRTPILKDLIKNPDLADEVKLGDTQKILNYINTKVPRNIRANHLDILDTLSDIKGSQLDAFPEMAGVKQDYMKVIQPYNQVKQYFRFNKTLNAIKNGFGGPSGEEAVKSLGLPDEVVKQMGGYKGAVNLIRMTKKVAVPASVALIGGGTAGAMLKGSLDH